MALEEELHIPVVRLAKLVRLWQLTKQKSINTKVPVQQHRRLFFAVQIYSSMRANIISAPILELFWKRRQFTAHNYPEFPDSLG